MQLRLQHWNDSHATNWLPSRQGRQHVLITADDPGRVTDVFTLNYTFPTSLVYTFATSNYTHAHYLLHVGLLYGSSGDNLSLVQTEVINALSPGHPMTIRENIVLYTDEWRSTRSKCVCVHKLRARTHRMYATVAHTCAPNYYGCMPKVCVSPQWDERYWVYIVRDLM
jgi:hypothetical protein